MKRNGKKNFLVYLQNIAEFGAKSALTTFGGGGGGGGGGEGGGGGG